MMNWLRGQGYSWNHKRVYSVYCEFGLNRHIKLEQAFTKPLAQPEAANERCGGFYG